jgi:glycosyl-4,4'-diaponeurosporenoate acyltransferase
VRIELPVFWIVTLNVVLWPLIQLALAWGFTRMPADWFHPPESPEGADFHERWFGIRHWKDRLPDGAAWFGGGFAKGRLRCSDPDYLRRFIAETWRGELCHWGAFLFVPVFFLWNPWWGNLVMAAYAIAANGPCILAQRYNRIRMTGLLRKHQASRRIPEARSTG